MTDNSKSEMGVLFELLQFYRSRRAKGSSNMTGLCEGPSFGRDQKCEGWSSHFWLVSGTDVFPSWLGLCGHGVVV